MNRNELCKHLKSRFLDLQLYRTSVMLGDGIAQFLMYDLSGRLVGVQYYNPEAPKKHEDPRLARYFTRSFEPGVWGLENLDYNKRYLLVTEGVFNAAKLHTMGFNAIATLCNNPIKMSSWLTATPFETVGVCDGDAPGQMLSESTSKSVFLPDGEDVESLDYKELRKRLNPFFE